MQRTLLRTNDAFPSSADIAPLAPCQPRCPRALLLQRREAEDVALLADLAPPVRGLRAGERFADGRRVQAEGDLGLVLDLADDLVRRRAVGATDSLDRVLARLAHAVVD